MWCLVGYTRSMDSQNHGYNRQSSIPLADRMRPKNLEGVLGQDEILGKNSIIKAAVTDKKIPSLIFWGPPGSGKTTLARILANEVDAQYHELSAVTSGKADITKIVEYAKASQRLGEHTVLFLDEIHRFNKAQQDALLPHVENGLLTLIGATTENPSFEIISALLSRTTVLRLNPVSKQSIIDLLNRAMREKYPKKILKPEAAELIAFSSTGDVRSALNNLETSVRLAKKTITKKIVKETIQESVLRHDKNGESHYNLASALIKSMRGSQTDAAMYYLFRLIEGGEDPLFIARRIVIFASEDVGMASPHALTLATAAYQAVERIGMPESKFTLSQAVVAMCQAKKSRIVADAMYTAIDQVKKYPSSNVPLHLRNAPTKLMKDFGYNQNYQWEANFKPNKGFLPEDMQNI